MKFLYSAMIGFRSGCAGSIPLSTTATVRVVAFLNPAAARAWPSRMAPWAHCRDAIGSALPAVRRPNSVRTGGTKAYSTSFIRST